MLWIDVKYANLVGSRLRNFKRKSEYLFNASCPVCGDSSKNKNKARLYLYRQTHGIFVKCHKCQYSSTLGNLIKHVDSNLYSEYVLERYKTGNDKYVPHTDITEVIPSLKPEDDVLRKLKRIDKMPRTHYAVKYVLSRQIPESVWHLIYYTPKFFKYVNDNIKYQFADSLLKIDHPRLVIPFFDSMGKCFALQGRAFGKEIPKYYTIKIDENQDKIYGLDRIDHSKPVLITEGPIDSLFLPNALAMGSSNNLNGLKQFIDDPSKFVIVLDNEPKNKDICSIVEKSIELGYNVFIWPQSIVPKDINELVLSGMKPEDVKLLIDCNTVSGLEAKLKLTHWKKC
jgi:hypothetical protein